MKNPLKKIKSIFKKSSRRKELEIDVTSIKNRDRIPERIWPSGTWQLAHCVLNAQMDLQTQILLLESYVLELSMEFERQWGRKAGEMAGSNMWEVMPESWLPSEASLKKLCMIDKVDVKFMHYIVGRLESLGNLRP